MKMAIAEPLEHEYQEDDSSYPSRWPEKVRKALAEWICTREPWMDWAACINMGNTPEGIATFFPARGGNTREAKAICATCRVGRQCDEYGDKTESEYGVWNGITRVRGIKTKD